MRVDAGFRMYLCCVAISVSFHAWPGEPAGDLTAALLDKNKARAAAQTVIAERARVISSLRNVFARYRSVERNIHVRDAIWLAGKIKAAELVEDLYQLLDVSDFKKGGPCCGGASTMLAAAEYPAVEALIEIGLPALREATLRLAATPSEEQFSSSRLCRKVLMGVLKGDVKIYLRQRISELENAGDLKRMESLEKQFTLICKELAKAEEKARGAKDKQDE